MTVNELVLLLVRLNGNTRVMVNGYEGGLMDLAPERCEMLPS